MGLRPELSQDPLDIPRAGPWAAQRVWGRRAVASSLSGRQAEGHLVPGSPLGAVGELREERCPRRVARFSSGTLLSCRGDSRVPCEHCPRQAVPHALVLLAPRLQGWPFLVRVPPESRVPALKGRPPRAHGPRAESVLTWDVRAQLWPPCGCLLRLNVNLRLDLCRRLMA